MALRPRRPETTPLSTRTVLLEDDSQLLTGGPAERVLKWVSWSSAWSRSSRARLAADVAAGCGALRRRHDPVRPR